MEYNLPPTAWIISNKQPFGQQHNNENGEPKESLLLAGPNFIGRFVTTPKREMSCGITRLGPGACVETAMATGKVLHQLEVVLEKRLRVLVCDFTKDDRGRLWFLQVRVYSLPPVSLRR